MNIQKISVYNGYTYHKTQNKSPHVLTEVTSRVPHSNPLQMPYKCSFGNSVIYLSQKFEQEYPRAFFKKLIQEGVPCAYTGIEMISRSEVDRLQATNILNKPAKESLMYLSQYKQSLYNTEKKVLTYLEKQAVHYPDLTIQELLQLRYNDAEKALISRQAVVLNQLNILSRELPPNQFIQVRKLINDAFDKIFAQNPPPENRFRRKCFLYDLDKIAIPDQKMKLKLLKVAEKLPQSSDSVNSFIVKYSQPYKVKYDKNKQPVFITRDSQEIGLRLLYPSVATDEHIYPQKLYKWEEKARQCGDINAKNLSDIRVTILTSAFINSQKSDTLIDNFILSSNYDIKNNVQKHINRLIEIDKKWHKTGRLEDAYKLANYILLLKEEFQRRSNIININIDELETIIPKLNSDYEQHIILRNQTRTQAKNNKTEQKV